MACRPSSTGAPDVAVRSAALTLRPAQPADENLLRQMFAQSRPDLALLPPQLRDGLFEMQFRARQQHYAVSYPHARQVIIVAGGADVGQLVIDDAGVGDEAGEVRVVDLTVDAARRGRGIGSHVLRAVIANAAGRAVRLSVWSGNTDARRLYARLGFRASPDGEADPTGYLQLRHDAAKQEEN